jgi:hypothetical protein
VFFVANCLAEKNKMNPTTKHPQPPPLIPGDRALAIAQADPARAYADLSDYRIQLAMEDDGWHVDYELKETRLEGAGHTI